MSPIFVRPVREQLEHDRLIRFLLNKYKRKFDVAVNVGEEQTAPVKLGERTFFPDLVLTDGKKLAGLVEVETGESVNNLEAMAQWVHFSRARVPFHLYVPIPGFDAARRLCAHHNVAVAELWTYRPSMDGFDLVRVFQDASAVASGNREARKAAAAQGIGGGKPAPVKPAAAKSAPARPAPAKPSRTKAARPAAKATRRPRPAKSTRTTKPAARAGRASARRPARAKKAAAGKR